MKILDRKSFDLDASVSTMYTYHLFNFLTKNPALFFKHAESSFADIKELAKFFIDETGEYKVDEFEIAFEQVPANKRDDTSMTKFLKGAKVRVEDIFEQNKGWAK